MAIRITRNDAGNCINFVGSSNPSYWNACLSAVINSENNKRVDIINDIRSENEDEIQYEFYAVEFTDFADKDNNQFASAQAMVDYINENANIIGVSGIGADLTDTVVNFRLDQTSTSIIMDNGSEFGVNTIKAVADTDGTIHIHAIGAGVPSGDESAGEHKHFQKLDHTNVQINGVAASGGLNDVVNALNELFTVGPFEAVVISDPYATRVADQAGVDAGYELVGEYVIDPAGDDLATSTQNSHKAGIKSTATINQPGEFFTFQIRGEGQIGFGLIHTQASYDAGLYSGNAIYADPAQYKVQNSQHGGFQFSHHFHPTPNGPWTNYGANTSYSMRSGWSNATDRFISSDEGADWLAGNPVKIKVGIDENSFISIDYYNAAQGRYIPISRSGYPVEEGSEFHLGVSFFNNSARLYSAPKVHLLEEEAPTMYFRYIESPDGNFVFPLFATAEEANYWNEVKGGDGTSHAHTYVDDPTNTTWYMPETYNNMSGYHTNPNDANTDATNTFEGNAITWTEITSLSDADLVPSQFTQSNLTYDEGTALNLQLQPTDTTYTTDATISPSGSGLAWNSSARLLQGTLSDVPSDTTYVVTVVRTNSYGSSTGSFTITATHIPPAVAISGFTHIDSSDPLVDEDTLGDGSAVRVDDTVANGYRFKISDSFVTNNVLPSLQAEGDKVFIGFAPDPVSGWSGVTVGDFNCGFRFQYQGATTVQVTAMLGGTSMGTSINHSYGYSSLGLDFYLSNKDGVLEANYHQSSTSKDSEQTAADGGSWAYTETQDTGVTETRTVVIGTNGTTADIETAGLSEHELPAPPATNTTTWETALDFSGGNEYLKQVNSGFNLNPLRLGGQGSTLLNNGDVTKTAADSAARPFATTIVFMTDRNSSNQHIWNQGRGAGSSDVNIYLRTDASGNLYFGWGRGSNNNECRIAEQMTSNQWYGVYVASKGARFTAGDATDANLADAFDIRFTGASSNWTLGQNLSTTANWISTGNKMDRALGDFTIGGRGGNRNFHGKVASMVITTLQLDSAVPDDTEIGLMISDPKKWEQDYRVGQQFRYNGDSTSTRLYNPSETQTYWSNIIWLMGDGGSDSYANGIRNEVLPTDQNHTKLQLNSMVSDDFHTVSIPGLS